MFVVCESAYPQHVTDPLAKTYEELSHRALHGLEGIWLIPDDNIYVQMQIITPGIPATYELRVIASLDGKTPCGISLGTLSPNVDQTHYIANLPTSFNNTQPSKFKKVILTPDKDNTTLIPKIEKKSFNLSFSPMTLLPRFWRIVRLNITPSSDSAPIPGLIKIFPSSSNTPIWHTPRYL